MEPPDSPTPTPLTPEERAAIAARLAAWDDVTRRFESSAAAPEEVAMRNHQIFREAPGYLARLLVTVAELERLREEVGRGEE